MPLPFWRLPLSVAAALTGLAPILDGGLAAWKADGGQTTTAVPPLCVGRWLSIRATMSSWTPERFAPRWATRAWPSSTRAIRDSTQARRRACTRARGTSPARRIFRSTRWWTTTVRSSRLRRSRRRWMRRVLRWLVGSVEPRLGAADRDRPPL